MFLVHCAIGKKPGEVKMIKNNGLVEAHQVCLILVFGKLPVMTHLGQWDNASGAWQKIGDVVDAVGQNRKQLYEGKEYDYVFDVDIQDGVPPLKLPYNVTGTQLICFVSGTGLLTRFRR